MKRGSGELANIFGAKKKTMVLISGIFGTATAIWLYWNFCGWLNILNCTLPPIGIILVISYFMNKDEYNTVEAAEDINWFAVLGVVAGAAAANLVHWGIASINGMVIAATSMSLAELSKRNKAFLDFAEKYGAKGNDVTLE